MHASKKNQFISGSYLFIFCSFFKEEKKIEIQKLLDVEGGPFRLN